MNKKIKEAEQMLKKQSIISEYEYRDGAFKANVELCILSDTAFYDETGVNLDVLDEVFAKMDDAIMCLQSELEKDVTNKYKEDYQK